MNCRLFLMAAVMLAVWSAVGTTAGAAVIVGGWPNNADGQVHVVPAIANTSGGGGNSAGNYVSIEDIHTQWGNVPSLGQAVRFVLKNANHQPKIEEYLYSIGGNDLIEQFQSQLKTTACVFSVDPSFPDPLLTSDLTLGGPTRVRAIGLAGQTYGTFDTEMLSMDLAAVTPLGPVMVRESPTQASLGQVRIEDLGGGQARISSFFDVFIELSLDGGLNWVPADAPVHVTLVPEPGALLLASLGGLVLLGAFRRQQGRNS